MRKLLAMVLLVIALGCNTSAYADTTSVWVNDKVEDVVYTIINYYDDNCTAYVSAVLFDDYFFICNSDEEIDRFIKDPSEWLNEAVDNDSFNKYEDRAIFYANGMHHTWTSSEYYNGIYAMYNIYMIHIAEDNDGLWYVTDVDNLF